jgi:Protein of unknown function (DUF2797)
MDRSRARRNAVRAADRANDAGYLCRGVSWSDRRPRLVLVDVDGGQTRELPLLGERLGLRVLSAGPFCLGYSGAVDGVLTQISCPNGACATSGQQCEECVAKDEFRFAHHAHLGGYVPDALAAYLARPHWIYVATFADATSKVGTASYRRETSRLDEQGVVCGTFVAQVDNGRTARVYEDAITERAGIAQTKRRASKVAAWERPAPADAIRAEHSDAVQLARAALSSAADGSDVPLPATRWERPAASDAFFAGVPVGGWLRYPHDLNGGDHGFHVEAVAGSTGLARLREGIDAVPYVVDLGALAGCRIGLGPYASPNTPVQLGLF